ncbi:MAG TPA: hypothetical protein V6C97_28760 [Oculatellaceae cyanobacterium]
MCSIVRKLVTAGIFCSYGLRRKIAQSFGQWVSEESGSKSTRGSRGGPSPLDADAESCAERAAMESIQPCVTQVNKPANLEAQVRAEMSDRHSRLPCDRVKESIEEQSMLDETAEEKERERQAEVLRSYKARLHGTVVVGFALLLWLFIVMPTLSSQGCHLTGPVLNEPISNNATYQKQ